ncbi:uncharacterized protein PV09_01262 [Verruconis gallopava]|uniref:Histone chaperone domain-containing protein n=1 Tax=Verruconis gallopava TaxID=253628 RepID=A0A0D2AP67_9PEZI|nr:uncharacterized protein PV09_01262 [Verruconis gallopava]KIW08345.1 hypothetical protein PV09_01262 [Verruconis gallopava]
MSVHNTPAGDGFYENDYKSRPGQSEIPVDADDKAEQATGIHEGDIDPQADSDEQLDADDKSAIDETNIIGSRTRGATKQAGTYREPGDEEGLPSDTGVSATR